MLQQKNLVLGCLLLRGMDTVSILLYTAAEFKAIPSGRYFFFK